MALYAAYGSNLDPEQMLRRAPHSPLRGTGWLRGWRLTFGGEELGWDGALTTVVEDGSLDSEGVFVAVYDVLPADEPRLDEWEGGTIGLYRKLRVRVHLLDGEAVAWVYVLDAYEGGLPSARSITTLANAARAAGAPQDYLERIRALPCRGED